MGLRRSTLRLGRRGGGRGGLQVRGGAGDGAGRFLGGAPLFSMYTNPSSERLLSPYGLMNKATLALLSGQSPASVRAALQERYPTAPGIPGSGRGASYGASTRPSAGPDVVGAPASALGTVADARNRAPDAMPVSSQFPTNPARTAILQQLLGSQGAASAAVSNMSSGAVAPSGSVPR